MHPRAGVHPDPPGHATPTPGEPLPYLLLVSTAILQRALLFLLVPAGEKKGQSEGAPNGRTGPLRQEGPKIISCQGNGNLKGTRGPPHLGPRKAGAGLDLPGTFIEFDGEADNLVVAQGPLLLLKDLTAVFVGAIGDCGRETGLEHCSWGHVEWKLPHRNTWTHPNTDIQTDIDIETY